MYNHSYSSVKVCNHRQVERVPVTTVMETGLQQSMLWTNRMLGGHGC